MYRILSASIPGEEPLPDEYVVWLLACKINKFMHEVRAMPEDDFQKSLMFMRAEAEADRLKRQQRGHYHK